MGAAPRVRPGSATVAEQRQLELVPGRKVWRVAELTAQVRELLERAFRDLWVQGEVSNFRVSPYGHYYFTLKDASAQLRRGVLQGEVVVAVRRDAEVRHLALHPEVAEGAL